MELYSYVNRLKTLKQEPPFEFSGELIHFAKVGTFSFVDTKERFLVTSLVKRKDDNLIQLFYNGKRITGKRISRERPVYQASDELLTWICQRIRMGEVE